MGQCEPIFYLSGMGAPVALENQGRDPGTNSAESIRKKQMGAL
jgi:hypothetical protein